MYNSVYFDFAMTPVEGEALYRNLNAVLNAMDPSDPNFDATIAFRDRVAAFCTKHPCRYGSEALS